MNRFSLTVLPCALIAGLLGNEAIAVNIETVLVGNPGNPGELSGAGAGGYGSDVIVGGVAYTYQIGKFEVTTGQYCEFLNAVAKTDTYGLYNPEMWSWGYTCGINRTGVSGSYTYTVASDWANRPVGYVSWGDVARFANWMHNGQPKGPQGLSTTEDGSYSLKGATSNYALMAVKRNAGATWVIPTEDEWYKAAYHKNDGITGNYWKFPTGSDTMPSNDLVNPDPGNHANYEGHYIDWTIGPPYYRTEVGEFENSGSPYGTFDQGGNVWEWNEAAMVAGTERGLRGGSFVNWVTVHDGMRSSIRQSHRTIYDYAEIGFRLAYIPEPATLALLSLGCFVALPRRAL